MRWYRKHLIQISFKFKKILNFPRDDFFLISSSIEIWVILSKIWTISKIRIIIITNFKKGYGATTLMGLLIPNIY
jgi:hypothetical protein